MKRIFGLLVLFVSLVLLSAPISCGRCQTCILIDINGSVMGQMELCGDELDAALDQPDLYDCN